MHLPQYYPPSIFHPAASASSQGDSSIAWRSSFFCNGVSGPRYAQPIPSLVHLHLPVLRPWITPGPPHFHPKCLAFAMAQPFISCDWLHKPSTGGSLGSQELRRRSCGALPADTHIVKDKECLPMNVLFHLTPCPSATIQPLPGRAQAQGGAVQVVTRCYDFNI
jgi:hypothetical protein